MVSFVNESSIHGVAYIFGPNRNIFVRIFWGILFVLSIFSAFYLIQGAHEKWVLEPFISVTKSKVKYAKDFPQFAVTVCPSIISDDSSLTPKVMRVRIRKEDMSDNDVFSEEECFNIRANSLWCGEFRDLTNNWAKKSGYVQERLCQ